MYETELYLTFLETFQQFENRMKAFDPQWIAFKNFVKTGIQFAVCTKTRMPAVSPPPEGSTTDFPFFCEICFSLWFRSDALSVSLEPELQIHSVFQGFLFLFSKVLVFSMESKVFLKVRKKVYFLEFLQEIYIYTYLSIYLSIHPSIPRST